MKALISLTALVLFPAISFAVCSEGYVESNAGCVAASAAVACVDSNGVTVNVLMCHGYCVDRDGTVVAPEICAANGYRGADAYRLILLRSAAELLHLEVDVSSSAAHPH